MARPSNWPKGKRHGGRRRELPASTKRRILHQQPACWFEYPGICTHKATQVHHILDVEDGGTDDDENLAGVCEPCHTHYSAQQSQKRAVAAAWEWKRKPEKHPGVLD